MSQGPTKDRTMRIGLTGMGYDGMDAVFDDTCGNLVNLHQD
jgi:hypothetical protein